MSGMTSAGNQHLIRTDIWSRQIKELLLDDLNAMKFVRMIQDFPDGSRINIPSIGESEVADFNENMAIKYNALDTGNFTFNFDAYKYSANAISEKFKRDSFYASDVIAAFPQREHRALMVSVETDILSKPNAGQTASDLNAINGGDHRFVASGTTASLVFRDLARARYALTKANVPLNNLVGIIDPSVAFTLGTQTNMMNLLTPNMQWSEMVSKGNTTGFKFMFNIMGFDLYISNYLPLVGSETINSVSGTNLVANYFFSASPGDTMPLIGGFRQMPTVYSEFNKDLQQTEHLTIAEWGFKLYRPENMVTILTSTAVVS